MKLAKLLFVFGAMMSLVACGSSNGGELDKEPREVTREEFRAEAAKVEQHHYTEATMTWSYIERVDTQEDVHQGTSELQLENGAWSYKSGDSYSMYVGGRSINSGMSYYADMSEMEGHTTKFYVNPYKFVISPIAEANLTNKKNFVVVFNEYGLCTSYNYNILADFGDHVNEVTNSFTIVYR